MPKFRLKIIKQRAKARPSYIRQFFQDVARSIQKRIYLILDNDILPLIIAPFLFVIFTGLEWWRWYQEIPTPFPILLTFIALGVIAYCSHKLIGNKKSEHRQKDLQKVDKRHRSLRQKEISNVS